MNHTIGKRDKGLIPSLFLSNRVLYANLSGIIEKQLYLLAPVGLRERCSRMRAQLKKA